MNRDQRLKSSRFCGSSSGSIEVVKGAPPFRLESWGYSN